MTGPGPDEVARSLSRHAPIYRTLRPRYQTTLLADLALLWDPARRRVLDVGGGTGVIAQAIQDLFPVDKVTTIDVRDRFLPTLGIETKLFDGVTIPFADAAFDCVTLSNVIHHVPLDARPRLLRECRRVAGSGPIYIKDHLAVSRADHLRLTALDLMGNLPFGGMLWAKYLSEEDWRALATEVGDEIARRVCGQYRRASFAAIFPNRLEVAMKWTPLSGAEPLRASDA